jgi:multidrug resistance protein MdtO
MASLAESVRDARRPGPWLWQFLKEELTPYPGRTGTVARMVIAATLVMLVCVTFRIPFAFQGAIYALLVTRESPQATVKSAGTIFLVSVIGAAYILISVWFVVSDPALHFLWILGSFFLAFYGISVITNYGASSIFAVMVSTGIPLWDRHVPAETNVEDTLRLLLASFVGVSITALVEVALVRTKPGDDIVLPIAERLATVRSLLECLAEGRSVNGETEKKLTTLAVRGTSILRRLLRRSVYTRHYRAEMGSVVALVGRLVDLAATLTQLRVAPSANDRAELRTLASTVDGIRTALLNHQIPGPRQFHDESSRGVPLLREMENTVALIPHSFEGSHSIDEYLPPDEASRAKFFAPDALVNSDHLKFALKGCLAASLCYAVYNAIAWPAISTSVTTCLLTALSTIGASRQKQVLRFAGTAVGGFVVGMGSQIFLLPYIDTIAGFTVLFMLVTALASWIMTSSPRLSYFGLQLALAYYLINLQEFAIQSSISTARDRVVGVLLGLVMMWLVFDQLWSAPASVEMKREFVSTLRLLAQLAREPVSQNIRMAIERTYALRETINTNVDRVRSLADGVLFEFGPSRQQHLALRDRIRRWQPRLRTLFLMRVASLKYRLQLPGFELPDEVRRAQQIYDERSADILDDLAGLIEGSASNVRPAFPDTSELLGHVLETCCGEEAKRLPELRVQSFGTLLREIDRLTDSLAEGIAMELDPVQVDGLH